jgi:hypothetical protein
LLNKDRYIENDSENVARAIIQIKNHIIKKIHTLIALYSILGYLKEGKQEQNVTTNVALYR